MKKPTNVGHVDAAAAIGDALKAYTALYYLAKVSSGDTILICNGASVGYQLLQSEEETTPHNKRETKYVYKYI